MAGLNVTLIHPSPRLLYLYFVCDTLKSVINMNEQPYVFAFPIKGTLDCTPLQKYCMDDSWKDGEEGTFDMTTWSFSCYQYQGQTFMYTRAFVVHGKHKGRVNQRIYNFITSVTFNQNVVSTGALCMASKQIFPINIK